jgi:hypothetical protein
LWTKSGQNFDRIIGPYELKKKIAAYVKDEGFNLNIMMVALKSIGSCDVLGLEFFLGNLF